MPKNSKKESIPSDLEMDYERANKIWTDFAGRLGEQVSQVLKERAEYQKSLYMRWMELLKTQGVGSDDKITEAVHEYEKLYSHWTEFAENTGEKIKESMLGSWDEQKGNYNAWLELFRQRAKDLDPLGTAAEPQVMDKMWGDFKSFSSIFTPKEGAKVEFPKETFENWLRFYTESVEVILKSPAFVALLGTMLDSTMDMKKKNDEQTAEIIRSLGLPSRKDMDSIYKKLHELGQKVNTQTQEIKTIKKRK